MCIDRAGSLFMPPHQLSHLHKSKAIQPRIVDVIIQEASRLKH
jgi:hypothetical protein